MASSSGVGGGGREKRRGWTDDLDELYHINVVPASCTSSLARSSGPRIGVNRSFYNLEVNDFEAKVVKAPDFEEVAVQTSPSGDILLSKKFAITKS
ncbi:hypothetical protein ZWY2020_056292 [Hordeum vulgare]|nr:hypothetical protein ZWY2020_056292 [Hordeum vulgare]